MAFTKTPALSTYKTEKILLMKEYNSRTNSFSKDVDYLNVFFESTQNKLTGESYYDVMCRAGLQTFGSTLQSTNVRQVYYWESQEKYYIWVDDDIQIMNTSGTITATVTSALGTSSGSVAVTEFLYDNGTVKLVYTDGSSLRTIDTANTVVTSADADLPTPLITSLVFLDGYLFVVKSGTSDIYNSNLNDPLAFTAGDFISAEMVPDTLTHIAKLNNYLIAFGSSSVEYFWDAANASGSPLQRNDTPVKFNGFLGGFAQLGNKVYFLGNNTESSPSIFVLEDFRIKELGNEALRRQLALTEAAWSAVAVMITFSGHSFYVVTLGSTTYAVDVETELWSRWAKAGFGNLNFLASTNSKSSTLYLPVVYVVGDTKLAKFNQNITTDFDTAYSWQIITGLQDFDSYNTKALHRLIVVGDRPSTDTTMTIYWTDDDYQTYNLGQTVNLNQELPCIYQCGAFRRRAFKLTMSPTVPIRVRYLEADINVGNT